MPSRNTVKIFEGNSNYHIYNRGVEKKRIFEDAQDYQKFIYYLKIYLTPAETLHQELPLLRKNLTKNNLSEEISLLSFCLMPNHFHLLLHQKTKDGITKLMRQLTTAYSMYFNKRYDRVGPLFQGIYKACAVNSDEQLLHLSRYIHINPLERDVSLNDFQWSSYLNYTANKPADWLNTGKILEILSTSKPNASYKNFTEKQQDLQPIAHLLLED